MSLSTTETTVYVLTKYSRAYPSSTSGAQDANAEWQHFTNPVIRLVLDMKKDSRSDLESYRVRILWSINSGQDSMDLDQHEVVFEDLELLSFSSSAMLQSQKEIFAVHGLPLKAVYRDSVVGIRYLHPRVVPVGTTPAYRRIQMEFQQASDATSFIDAIRHVCPCKANAPPAAAQAMTMVPSSARTIYSVAGSMQPPEQVNPKQPLRPSMTMQDSPTVVRRDNIGHPYVGQKPAARTSLRQSSTLAVQSTRPNDVRDHTVSRASHSNSLRCSTSTSALAQEPAIHDSTISRCTEPRVPAHTTTASGQPLLITYPNERGPVMPHPFLQSNGAMAPAEQPALCNSRSDHHTPSSSLPSSSPPFSNSSVVPPPSIANEVGSENINGPETSHSMPARTQAPVSPAAFIEDLRESTALYDLPSTDLEKLVAQVVREEGFVTLLKSLDSMWKVKTLLGPVS